jgi:hypothetical protein
MPAKSRIIASAIRVLRTVSRFRVSESFATSSATSATVRLSTARLPMRGSMFPTAERCCNAVFSLDVDAACRHRSAITLTVGAAAGAASA